MKGENERVTVTDGNNVLRSLVTLLSFIRPRILRHTMSLSSSPCRSFCEVKGDKTLFFLFPDKRYVRVCELLFFSPSSETVHADML